MAVLDDELHCGILDMHVGHLPFKLGASHDGWGKNHSKVLGRHLVIVSNLEFVGMVG